MEESFSKFGAMKKEFDTLKAELINFNMTKEHLRQMSELIQLVNSQKVQHTAEMLHLKLAHAIQVKELRKEKNSSADRLPPQGGQILSGTDLIQFV